VQGSAVFGAQRQLHRNLRRSCTGMPSVATRVTIASARMRFGAITQRVSRLSRLHRGSFNASAKLLGPVAGEEPHLPDTFLRMPGFTKGVAFVNGFNLGWCACVCRHQGRSWRVTLAGASTRSTQSPCPAEVVVIGELTLLTSCSLSWRRTHAVRQVADQQRQRGSALYVVTLRLAVPIDAGTGQQ